MHVAPVTKHRSRRVGGVKDQLSVDFLARDRDLDGRPLTDEADPARWWQRCDPVPLLEAALLSTAAPTTSQGPHDRAAHGTVVPADVRRGAAVGELHADPQQLWREQITPLADDRPVPSENVRSGPVALATKLVIRDAGARADLELESLRVGIDVVDIDRRLLRARQEQFADRRPQRRALRPPGPGRRIDRLSLLGPRARGRLKESAHTATLNALLMRRHSMPSSAGSAESSSRGSTVQAPAMSPTQPPSPGFRFGR